MRLTYLIILYFFSFLLKAQKNEDIALGSVQYKQVVNFGTPKIFFSTLNFNNYKSSYSATILSSNGMDSVSSGEIRKISIMEKSEIFVYKDIQNQEMNAIEYVLTKSFTVKDSIPNLQWEFGNGEKKIGKFLCHNAFANFRGRKYEAWFCPDIAIQNGPWKLGGLPGLILEASDSTSEVQFFLESIRLPLNEKIIIKLLDTSQSISFDQYKLKWKEKLINLRKQMQSSSSSAQSNFDTSVGFSQIDTVEKLD